MPVTVACEHCGKRYTVNPSMMGRKVRCRGCGETFAVPRDDSADNVEQVDALEQLSESSANANFPDQKGTFETPTRSAGELSRFTPPVAEEEAEEESKPVPQGRLNVPLDYPYADVIDRWLPYLLIALSVAWVSGEMLRSNELVRASWVPFVRIGTFWALYTLVIWPITLAGTLAVGRKLDFQMPPQHGFRVYATFSFPTVLGYILWSINGGLGSFVTGAIVGLAIALGIFWVLFRLQTDESSRALPVVAGWFASSLTAGVVAIIALNFALQTILTAARTANDYATSPMGRYLAWNPPQPADLPGTSSKLSQKPKPPKGTDPSVGGPTFNPIEPVAIKPDSTKPLILVSPNPEVPVVSGNPVQPTNPVVSSVSANPPKPADDPFANPAVVAEKPVNKPIPIPEAPVRPGGSTLFSPDVSKPTETVPVPEVPPSIFSNPVVGTEPVDRSSPVFESSDVKEIGSFDDVIFPSVPSKYLGVVRHKSVEEDQVEVWCTNPVKMQGSALFRHDLATEVPYVLSPSGKLIARIASFPTLSAQIWSVEETKVARLVTLNKNNGSPALSGFSDNTTMWVLWELQGRLALEGWDAISGARGKTMELSPYDRAPGNYAVSPDGKFVAMLKPVKLGAPSDLHLFGLRGGGQVKRYSLTGIDRDLAITVTGIAFSSDSTKVALLIEHRSQGSVLMAWSITGSDTKPIAQHLFPAGFKGGNFPGRLLSRCFDWLPDNNGWLINGAGLYDFATGQLIGTTGIEKAYAQRISDNKTVEIIRDSIDGGKKRLTIIPLTNPKAGMGLK